MVRTEIGSTAPYRMNLYGVIFLRFLAFVSMVSASVWNGITMVLYTELCSASKIQSNKKEGTLNGVNRFVASSIPYFAARP